MIYRKLVIKKTFYGRVYKGQLRKLALPNEPIMGKHQVWLAKFSEKWIGQPQKR